MDATPSSIQPQEEAQAPIRKRGRPKGSKNKPKPPGSVYEMKPNDGRRGKGWVYDPDHDQRLKTATAKTTAKPKPAAKPKTRKRKAAGTSGQGVTVKRAKRVTPKMTAVHTLLEALGVKDTHKVSNCLKQGILNGFVKLKKPKDDPSGEFGLDQVILEGDCDLCSGKLTCRVRDILYQPDYGGNDYEDGAEEAPFKCYFDTNSDDDSDGGKEEDTDAVCHGWYVTGLCQDNFTFDSGKFHNHCCDCPQFGYCIGDYREQHCPNNCGNHFFACRGMFKCTVCT